MDWIQRVKKKDKTSQMMVSFTRIRNTNRGPGLGERIMSLIWDTQSETPVGWARVDTHWSVSYVGLEVRRNTGTGGTGLGISNIEMVNGSTMPGKTTVFLCSICSPNPCNGKFTLSPPFSNLLLPHAQPTQEHTTPIISWAPDPNLFSWILPMIPSLLCIFTQSLWVCSVPSSLIHAQAFHMFRTMILHPTPRSFTYYPVFSFIVKLFLRVGLFSLPPFSFPLTSQTTLTCIPPPRSNEVFSRRLAGLPCS